MKTLYARLLDASPTFNWLIMKAIGFLSGIERPRFLIDFVIGRGVERFGIDLDDFAVPPGGYRSYRQFHARTLGPGKRHWDFAGGLVAPCDALILESGRLTEGCCLRTKGIQYTLEQLTGMKTVDLKKYNTGAFLTLYLPVEGYHRWHAPLTGRLVRNQRIAGRYLSLDWTSLRLVKNIFSRNVRLVQELEDGTHRLLLIAVGGVAATDIQTEFEHGDRLRIPVERGRELGAFCIGSSIILVGSRNYGFKEFAPLARLRAGAAIAEKSSSLA